MRKTFLVFLLTSFSLTTQAQKLKEKKDIVYLDGVPQYKLEKSDGSLLKGISYLATSLANDTLVRFNFKAINVPLLPHEKSVAAFWTYYSVDFAPLGKTLEMDIMKKSALMDEMHKYGIIVDGKLSEEAAEKMSAANTSFNESKSQVDSAVIRRMALLSDKSYTEYSKTLVPRSRWDDQLSISGYDIMIGSIIEAPVKIGLCKVGSDNRHGILYQILRPNGKQVATIFFEKDKKRIYTKTDYDMVGRETFIELSEISYAQVLAEIKLLVLNGYL